MAAIYGQTSFQRNNLLLSKTSLTSAAAFQRFSCTAGFKAEVYSFQKHDWSIINVSSVAKAADRR